MHIYMKCFNVQSDYQTRVPEYASTIEGKNTNIETSLFFFRLEEKYLDCLRD